eukprot:m.763168 g.763168  ORF g.763168 m.763168 type:complete len:52 (-) comp59055_c0_seq11:3-158(-)
MKGSHKMTTTMLKQRLTSDHVSRRCLVRSHVVPPPSDCGAIQLFSSLMAEC